MNSSSLSTVDALCQRSHKASGAARCRGEQHFRHGARKPQTVNQFVQLQPQVHEKPRLTNVVSPSHVASRRNEVRRADVDVSAGSIRARRARPYCTEPAAHSVWENAWQRHGPILHPQPPCQLPPPPPPFSLKHAVRNHNITASTPTLVKMNALTTCGGSGEERVGKKKEKKDVGGEEREGEKKKKKRRGSWCVQGDESVNSETHTPRKKSRCITAFVRTHNRKSQPFHNPVQAVIGTTSSG